MKVSEFRQLPDEDLAIEIRKRQEGLFQIRLKAAN